MRIGSIGIKQFFETMIVNVVYNEAGRPISRDILEFKGGFHIAAQVMDCGDGMFQEIQHPAVFKTLVDAEAFKEKISRNRMSWNLTNWRIGDHPCDAYQRKPEDNPLFYCVYNPTPAF